MVVISSPRLMFCVKEVLNINNIYPSFTRSLLKDKSPSFLYKTHTCSIKLTIKLGAKSGIVTILFYHFQVILH